VLLLALLLNGSTLLADSTTQPTQTACDVYLTPFTSLGGDNTLDWVGKAVQQNLLTDLARTKLHPSGSDKPLSNADAQASARAMGAKYLISGSYQVADQQLRFNGQIIDAGTGNVLGGISATGAVRDLFAMEDQLSSQAIQQLGNLAGGGANAGGGGGGGGGNAVANNKPGVAGAPAAPVAAQPPVVVQIVQPAAAAPVVRYHGSALEQYVNSNRNPSADYSQPPLDSQLNDNFASTPGSNYNAGYDNQYPYGYGLGLGNFGFGFVYTLPPYGRFGYGTDGQHHHDHGSTDGLQR
jgi:TolB-like protein